MAARRPRAPLDLSLKPDLVQDNLPSQVVDRVWIGSIHAAFNQEGLHDRGITHVLNASGLPATFPRQFTYFSVDLRDKENSNILAAVGAANIFIEAGVEKGGVLVHCAGGRSRSAAFVAAFLMSSTGASYEAALSIVKAARPVVAINRGFELQLRAYSATNCDVFASHQVMLRLRLRMMDEARKSTPSELRAKRFTTEAAASPAGAKSASRGNASPAANKVGSSSGSNNMVVSSGNNAVVSSVGSNSYAIPAGLAPLAPGSRTPRSPHHRQSRSIGPGSLGGRNGGGSHSREGDKPSESAFISAGQPRPARLRLSRPGSASVQVIPPLGSLERVYACRACGAYLLTAGNLVNLDIDIPATLVEELLIQARAPLPGSAPGSARGPANRPLPIPSGYNAASPGGSSSATANGSLQESGVRPSSARRGGGTPSSSASAEAAATALASAAAAAAAAAAAGVWTPGHASSSGDVTPAMSPAFAFPPSGPLSSRAAAQAKRGFDFDLVDEGTPGSKGSAKDSTGGAWGEDVVGSLGSAAGSGGGGGSSLLSGGMSADTELQDFGWRPRRSSSTSRGGSSGGHKMAPPLRLGRAATSSAARGWSESVDYANDLATPSSAAAFNLGGPSSSSAGGAPVTAEAKTNSAATMPQERQMSLGRKGGWAGKPASILTSLPPHAGAAGGHGGVYNVPLNRGDECASPSGRATAASSLGAASSTSNNPSSSTNFNPAGLDARGNGGSSPQTPLSCSSTSPGASDAGGLAGLGGLLQLQRPQSAEKRRWLSRMQLLENTDHRRSSKLAEQDEAMGKLLPNDGRLIYAEHMEWMGNVSAAEQGKIVCPTPLCGHVLGEWTWERYVGTPKVHAGPPAIALDTSAIKPTGVLLSRIDSRASMSSSRENTPRALDPSDPRRGSGVLESKLEAFNNR